MKTSIIVPVYNKIEVIFQCLKLNVEHASQPCQWVVIDNNSDTSTKIGLMELKEWATGLGHNFSIVNEMENTGVAKAWNKGLSLALGEYICILNNDCVMMPNWDQALSGTNLDLMTPLVVEPHDFGKDYTLPDFLGNANNWEYLLKRNAGRYRGGYFSGIVIFGKKSVFDQVGAFDEHFWLSMEDMDYIFRARKLGCKVGITGDCVAYHFSSLTRKSVSHNEDANQAWFAGKWGWNYGERERSLKNKWIKSWQKKTWKYFQVLSQRALILDK